MEKMMRKLTALIMVLSLLAGTMALPAAATETGQEEASQTSTEVSVTVEIKDSEGTVIGEKTTTTITDSSGEVTGETTVSTTTSTGSGGEQITQQTTTSTAGTENGGTATQTATSTTTTTTDVADTESGYTKTTDTDTVWKEETVEKDPSTTEVINDSTTQTTEVSTTTVTEGSQEQTDIVDRDSHAGETHYSGSTEGSETTTITDTTTTTTVTTDAELTSTTEGPAPVLVEKDVYDSDWSENYIPDETGEWAANPSGDITDSTYETISDTVSDPVSTTKEEDLVEDPLANTNITLEMDAPEGNEDYTVSEEKNVTIQLGDLIPPESDTVKHVYENGKLVGYITYSDEMPSPDNAQSPIVPSDAPKTDADYTKTGEDVELVMPAEPKKNTSDDENTVIDTVITPLEDALGYHVVETKVVTTPYDGTLDPLTGNQDDFVNQPVIPEDAVWCDDNSYIQLPQKPAESEQTDENGNVTKVTVEELKDDAGSVIGFKTTTRITDAEGTLISRSSISEYGTITTFTSTTTRDPDTQQVTTVTESTILGLKGIQNYISNTSGYKDLNTTRVAEEDIYQMVNTDDGLVFLYQGKMYKVVDKSTSKVSTQVATDETVDLDKYIAADQLNTNGTGSDATDLRRNGENMPNNTPNTITANYTGEKFYVIDEKTGEKIYITDEVDENDEWSLTGYGLYADFSLWETDGFKAGKLGHTAKQFEIQKQNADGTTETRYVYCVELGTGIEYGSNYGSVTYDDSKDSQYPWKDANNQNSAGNIGQIRSVALNGYWGTENGLGSLEAVKDLMRRNNLKNEAELLTPGMALTATQVAIWEFGATTSGQFGGYDKNGNAYDVPEHYRFIGWDDSEGGLWDGSKEGQAKVDQELWHVVSSLRDLLVDLAYDTTGENARGKAEEIDADDITGSAITLKNKISDGENGADVYNTDVSFTLDVSTSSINGDMIVKVYSGGKEVGRARLAGDDSKDADNWSLLNLINFGKIYPENGTYTIKNVELTSGVVVDLQLTGTQHLDDGVYIFKSDSKQDFIGLSKLEKNVDLTISMEFNAKDPQITHTERSWKEIKTDKEAYVRTDNFHKERSGTRTTSNVTVTTKLYGTNTQTDVATAVTTAHRDWERYYSYTLSDPAEGGSSQSDDVVEKADAPKTGDSTALLALISLFSAGGYVLLNRKKEEE